jgi:hypothetical protein
MYSRYGASPILGLLIPLVFASAQVGLDHPPVQLVGQVVARTPSQYRVSQPVNCDLEGRIYARATRAGEGPSPVVIEFDLAPPANESLRVTAFGDPDQYSVDDNVPDPNGGLFAIAVRHHPRSAAIIHFDNYGKFTGTIPIAGMSPKRLSAFADGSLLIGGVTVDADSKEAPFPSGWEMGI